MTHPVLPPEPLPIVHNLSSEGSTSAAQSVMTMLSSPRPSEPSASKSSQLNAAKSAALLGPPLAIGDPVEQVEPQNSADNSADAAAPPRSIQPLKVSDDASSAGAIAKLKKFTTETITGQESSTQPPSPDDASQLPAPQPGETSPQAPDIPTQPEKLPTPGDEQRRPILLPAPVPAPPQLPATPQPQNPPQSPTTPQSTPPATERVVELTSDRQQYDQQRQIVTAEGKAVLRFDGAVLEADRLQLNVSNLIAVGEGNVTLTRGQQLVRGQRFTYNFVQDNGDIFNARGDIYLPTSDTDFSPTLPTDVTAGGVVQQPAGPSVRADQPLQQVTSPGGISFAVGSSLPRPTGAVRRVRFEAERVDLNPEGWQARNVRLTNDPFSPPELEVRANTVTLTRETPLRTRIKATRPRLVLDRRLSLPIPRNEAVIDRRPRSVSPAIAQLGFDADDRGGLFVERSFTPIDLEQFRLRLTPQIFLQRALQNGFSFLDPANYGLRARLDGDLGPRTSIRGNAVFTTFDLNDLEEKVRGSLRLRQRIGNPLAPYTATLEYSYRDRLYNGTLGYQTVRSSIGGILTSPVIPLGKTGINLSYQLGAQYVNANTDKFNLLYPNGYIPGVTPLRANNRVSLGRFQGSAALSRAFVLWVGKALPSTANQGLRYTAAPVIPYLIFITGLSATSSFYTSGDNQTLFSGTVGLAGQLGHFSRPFFDYTSFNISYTQGFLSGASPFAFDRVVDKNILSAGITQQIYGPFRIGVQTAINVETGRQLSTDYFLEYSRRTYGITVRYNPQLGLGAINFRISDFNWTGGSDPFSDSEVTPVLGGVRREQN